MSKLKELVNSLKAFTVVIIENDFTYQQNLFKIVARYCFSNPQQRRSLIKDLISNDFTELTEDLRRFSSIFDAKDHDLKLVHAIPAIDNFKHYLEKMEFNDLLEDIIFESLNDTLTKDEQINDFKDILLKNGYYSTYSNIHYDELLRELNEVTNCQILFYKNTPSEAKQDDFIKGVKTSMADTASNFYLAIIDKSLEVGGDDEAGKTFVKDLIKLNSENAMNFICCIYTTRPVNPANKPKTYEEYFVQEVQKNGENITEGIARVLAHSAYASVFNSIKVNLNVSSSKALDIVLKNQTNIKYIIDESHREGIQPYEAIKNWFNLSTQKNFDDREVDDFGFISGLASFFKHEYLEDHPQLAEISDELQKISTYELFDYNINKKFSPIAPGDIWECNGEYYLLVGQLCDLLIRREKNSRNAKIGELLKLRLIANNTEKKYEVEVKSSKKIKVSNFKTEDGDYKTVEVEISTPNIYYADLQVLDLAMYNSDGCCLLDIESELSNLTKKILPSYAENYYSKLKSFYNNAGILQLSMLSNEMDILGPLDFSKMKFIRNESVINHQIRRVSRLKGRYYDSLYNNYLNNKGRIDLNLIHNSPETATICRLKFKLFDDESTLQIVEDFKLWSSKGKKYLKLSELKGQFPKFADLFSYSEDEMMTFDNKKQYEMTEEEGGVALNYKYYVRENMFHSKSTFSYKDIFNEPKPNNNMLFKIIGSDDDISFINEQGHPTRVLTLDELKSGVIVYEKGVVLKIVDGIVTRQNYEQ